jgi:hypothetical protein
VARAGHAGAPRTPRRGAEPGPCGAFGPAAAGESGRERRAEREDAAACASLVGDFERDVLGFEWARIHGSIVPDSAVLS